MCYLRPVSAGMAVSGWFLDPSLNFQRLDGNNVNHSIDCVIELRGTGDYILVVDFPDTKEIAYTLKFK